MKFLCMACDDVMTLRRAEGPNNGSMTVVFQCPSCEREIAMLTNAMETQMVRSLDVKLGGRSVPAEPMSVVRGALQREGSGTAHGIHEASKCPFSGAVSTAIEQGEAADGGGIVWTAEAAERIERVPSYIRDMVRKGIEDYADQVGRREVDVSLMEEVRGRFGM